MKRLAIASFATATIVALSGCASGEPDVSAQDKANLERLHKEGIGKVMADDMAKQGKKAPDNVSLANPTGGPGPSPP